MVTGWSSSRWVSVQPHTGQMRSSVSLEMWNVPLHLPQTRRPVSRSSSRSSGTEMLMTQSGEAIASSASACSTVRGNPSSR